MVINDDVYHKNQASIRFEWLTVGFPACDDSRTQLDGRFEITDQSSNHELIKCCSKATRLDWEYRTGGDTTWQPHAWNGPEADRSRSTARRSTILCAYSIVDIDGVTGNPPATSAATR
jgi:hypothetical protein